MVSKNMTQGEVAAFIDSHLKENGINVVLSGGASVAVYSNNLYVSKDLDFVAQFNLDIKAIDALMKEMGFFSKGNYYTHTQTEYYAEFISGPPTIGSEPIEKINEIKMKTGILRIISPTDCVKDRLAAYYFWDDRQGFEQAILVSKSNQIDMENVESWSVKEGYKEKFDEFIQKLVD